VTAPPLPLPTVAPPKRVIGLDLSLTATGVAYPSGRVATWRSKHRGCERLLELRDDVLAAARRADLVVMEGYAFGRPQQAHYLGELGGVVRLGLYEVGTPFVVVPPSVLKGYACGRGNAPKDEVLVSAVRRLGYEGADNNQADALWLRAIALEALGAPVVELPEMHRKWVSKVKWEEVLVHA